MSDRLPNVEDFYPLAPMQQGMLYHTLAAPRSDAYCQQASFSIEGPLDEDIWARAWQHVVDTHPILRTSFVWKGPPEPVQVVNQDDHDEFQVMIGMGDSHYYAPFIKKQTTEEYLKENEIH